MRASNARSGSELANKVEVAVGIVARLKGLIGRRGLADGEALLIRSCKGVHTVGMRFPIDVVFLDRHGKVVGIKEKMPPNRMSAIYLRASSALELPAGVVERSRTRPGDTLTFS